MKRVFSFLLVLLLIPGLVGCGQSGAATSAASAPTWQEQYDLGVRYLSEGNYKEAIIAFTAAIEIDPKRPDAYAKLAEVYTAQGDWQAAADILEKGYDATGDEGLRQQLEQAQQALSAAEMAALAEELRPTVQALDIPFTVDGVILGETDISVPIAAYSSRPYAMSNLMEDDTENTVYTCFGMNDMPIPEGYYEDQFGFLFAGPAAGGPVHTIYINDGSFTCLGALHVGDDAGAALSVFGLADVMDRLTGELVCETENGRLLQVWGDPENFYLTYQEGERTLDLSAEGGRIHSVNLRCQ